MPKRAKISVIGAGGNVGASVALWAANKELGDIVAVDLKRDEMLPVDGRMLDLAQAGPMELFDSNIVATDDFSKIEGSDVVVVTAGIPRKPGMSRDDLIGTNVKIVKSVSENVKKYAPDSIVILVSNPLDAMVYTAWKATGFPTNRIIGQAGCLDVARFKTFIAMETGFSVMDINAMLLGGHGDDMVPLPRFTNIAGIPVTEFISEERLGELVQRAKVGGGEIVKKMGTSGYIAPASGTVQMVEAIIKDKKRILPCAAYCDKEYGIGGYFVGVPAVLGKEGVEQIIEVNLNDDEKKLLAESASHVKDLVEVVKNLAPDLA
ncbi:MAG TPA: malate dehydrogenase [Phycisphaerales bacterium]|nr:malate dehydrogenase [Phycisphaerales bacterium]|tara:strand:+ start:3590 stop:4549 length:960 start_codon:yes stop_codon:yes gene_type:complete